jgi:hypothetical protein
LSPGLPGLEEELFLEETGEIENEQLTTQVGHDLAPELAGVAGLFQPQPVRVVIANAESDAQFDRRRMLEISQQRN